MDRNTTEPQFQPGGFPPGIIFMARATRGSDLSNDMATLDPERLERAFARCGYRCDRLFCEGSALAGVGIREALRRGAEV